MVSWNLTVEGADTVLWVNCNFKGKGEGKEDMDREAN